MSTYSKFLRGMAENQKRQELLVMSGQISREAIELAAAVGVLSNRRAKKLLSLLPEEA